MLEKRPDIPRQKLERTRDLMNEHAEDCLVTSFESLIDSLDLPDKDDRHVLAATIRTGAGVIVTCNTRGFPADKLALYGMEAQHPDDPFVGSQSRGWGSSRLKVEGLFYLLVYCLAIIIILAIFPHNGKIARIK